MTEKEYLRRMDELDKEMEVLQSELSPEALVTWSGIKSSLRAALDKGDKNDD